MSRVAERFIQIAVGSTTARDAGTGAVAGVRAFWGRCVCFSLCLLHGKLEQKFYLLSLETGSVIYP